MPLTGIEHVRSVDLAGTPQGIRSAMNEMGEVFSQDKTQAQIVASTVFAFAPGVEVEARQAISDSALLAQLVANQRFRFETDPLAWNREYIGLLRKIGWQLQQSDWNDYTASCTAVEVHEKVLEVLEGVLGPGAAALAIFTSALNALKGDGPWVTLFARETQNGRVARFQIAVAEKDALSGVAVTMLACVIGARDNIPQVLFFKFPSACAMFEANLIRASLDLRLLQQITPAIREKICSYTANYLSSIKDL